MTVNGSHCRHETDATLQDTRRRVVLEPINDAPACGPRCLREALFRLGIKVRLPDLTRRCRTSELGTSVRDLLAAAESFGLRAQVCKADIKLLPDLTGSSGTVAIAHVRRDHFVLVETVAERDVTLWDPNGGTRRLAVGGFQAMWEGVCVVISRPAPP